MNNLHALFALRNEQAFSRTLEASRCQPQAPLSSSAGRSWTRNHGGPNFDVNSRDWLGRTVLHLACSALEPCALTYVRLLLDHPAINVNVQDAESRWTALHRALYAGNIAIVILLLQREDTDTQLRDYDGYTAFDLYNSTVDGTALDEKCDQSLAADLFTWGVNRNAALGHGDAADRTYPDQVIIHPPTSLAVSSPAPFARIRANGISMAKLHTTVITDEPRGNLRVCGFGSGGRLGTGNHTQYSLQPVPQLTARITAISLGQDHTLALTSAGEVLSWGLNRFTQLGYIVEREEPVQTTARRVLGPLRKEHVRGVAACRSASACWTREDVFTWGTNSGQLGYDSSAQHIQVLPRKVTGVQSVTGIALTDSAMACLLTTMDVICFRADAHFRVRFPAPELAELPPYQHPHVVKPAITKITSSDDVFAALSTHGDVFTFATPPPPSEAVPRPTIKPQRIWSLRNSFDPAKDVALGSDGTLVVCTESGHVFVRRSGAKPLRVPLLHRIVRVCASSTGAFAALRLTPSPPPVTVIGPTLAEDMRAVRPWISGGAGEALLLPATVHTEDDEDDGTLEADVTTTARLCALLGEQAAPPTHLGADVLMRVGEFSMPAHRAVLAARSSALRGILQGSTRVVLRDGAVQVTYAPRKGTHIAIAGCHPMAVLLLLEYLYTDDIPALWDRRVGGPCTALFDRVRVVPGVVKTQLGALARALDLPALNAVLGASSKLVPAPTLARDMARLFRELVSPPDVVLELADRAVPCHAVMLRARSQFFRGFFDDADWTKRRWPPGGVLKVDMKHMEWRAVAFVVGWLCCDEEDGLFEDLEDIDSVSELLDLVFAVMAVASELLLDKLMLLCSTVILRHVTLHNVAVLLADATYYNALELVNSLQAYITRNMEAILESRLLDRTESDLINALETFVRTQQTAKARITRTGVLADAALRAHSKWLELQDIPQPLIRTTRVSKESPKLSPVGADKITARRPVPPMSPLSSPTLLTTKITTPKPTCGDEIFSMEEDSVPTLSIGRPQSPPNKYTLPPLAWKSTAIQSPARVDMKTIIAEAEIGKGGGGGEKSSGSRPAGSDGPGEMPKVPQKQSQRERRKLLAQQTRGPQEPSVRPSIRSPPSTSPWKLPTQSSSTSEGTLSMSAQRLPQHSITVGDQILPRAPVSRQPATPASIFRASGSALGPVFSPTTMPVVPRRAQSDTPAWTKAPGRDPAPSSDAGISFAAIQQQQRDQGQQPRGKQSLREIQQEEQSRQEEEDFLRWWAAEEQKLKVEAGAQVAADEGMSSKRGRASRGDRRGRGSGRGGGDVRGRGHLNGAPRGR